MTQAILPAVQGSRSRSDWQARFDGAINLRLQREIGVELPFPHYRSALLTIHNRLRGRFAEFDLIGNSLHFFVLLFDMGDDRLHSLLLLCHR